MIISLARNLGVRPVRWQGGVLGETAREMQWSAMSLLARELGFGPCFQLVTSYSIRPAHTPASGMRAPSQKVKEASIRLSNGIYGLSF